MLCLRCTARGTTSVARTSMASSFTSTRAVTSFNTSFKSSRAFSALSLRRPTLPSSSPFRPSSSPIIEPSASGAAPSVATLDIMPKVSAHPALAAQQVRCGPRRTFNPSHFVRKRRHGFLARQRSKSGQKILKRRRAKGRSTLSH